MGKARKVGIALVALGIAVCAGFFFISEMFTPDMGLKWNLEHMETVLKDNVVETIMDVSAFRERYPAYDDMDDQELSLRLRTKYFSKMPLEDYRKVFLGEGDSAAMDDLGESHGPDPLMIRWPIEDLKVTDIFTRAVMTSDAIEYGLLKLKRHRVAFPYRYALFPGLGLLVTGLAVLALSGKKEL